MNKLDTPLIRELYLFFDSRAEIIKGKTLCVCLSGGADSVALLRGTLMLADEFAYSVVAAHFNHMIRGAEADRDEEFCKELCDTLGVKLFCGRDDVPAYARLSKLSLEDAARRCRYAFFERILSKPSVDVCLTAHNMNDDAETLLINLIRGSGANGASSISPSGKSLFRPLLTVTRSEIEDFLKHLGQKYITDSTNTDERYTRNFIRNTVLPKLAEINPSVIKSLSRYAASSREDRDYFDTFVSELIQNDTDLRTLHPSVRKRVYIRKFYDFCEAYLNSTQINTLDACITSDSRLLLGISHEIEAVIENGRIAFYMKSAAPSDFPPIRLQSGEKSIFGGAVSVSVSNTNFKDSKTFNKIYTSALLSADSIIGDIFVRTRKIGDKILQNGMHKSVKKLFIDKKIPKEFRDIVPIFFDEEGIIFIPFVGISDRVSPKNSNNPCYISTVFNSIKPERWQNAYEK